MAVLVTRTGRPGASLRRAEVVEEFDGLGGELVDVIVELFVVDELAGRALTRGFVITVDYGAESTELYDPRLRPRGTLRAFRAHRFSDDPLADPGLQDLTTSVNWTRIKEAGESAGLSVLSLERQDQFLLRAGLLDQLERLSALAPGEPARATPPRRPRHDSAGRYGRELLSVGAKKAVICGP